MRNNNFDCKKFCLTPPIITSDISPESYG